MRIDNLDVRAAKILQRKYVPRGRGHWLYWVGTFSHTQMKFTLAWKNFRKTVKKELFWWL